MTAPSGRSSSQLVRLVATREVTSRLRDRNFLISSAVLIVLILGMLVFQVVINSGGDTTRVGLVGEAPEVVAALEQQGSAAGTDVEVVALDDEASGRSAVHAGDVDAALVGVDDPQPQLLVEDAGDSSVGLVQAALSAASITRQLADAGVALTAPAQAAVVALDPAEPHSVEAVVIAIVAVVVLYSLLILFAQFVAQGVVEEKSSRVVELLLATMKPWQLLTGKIIGLGLLGLAQLLLIAAIGVGGALAFDLVDLPGRLLRTVASVLVWFVFGYAFYAAVFAAAASLVSRQEDLAAVITPLSLVLIVGFVISIQAAQDPDGGLATATSLVPGLSPMVMPVRMAAGEAPGWQIALAVLLMLGAVVVVVRIGGRAYAGALLRTGGRVKLREALAAERS